MGAIGAKFYKSSTPPPGSSQPPPNQPSSNIASKEGLDAQSSNKSFGQSTSTKAAPPNSISTEKINNSNNIKRGKLLIDCLFDNFDENI